MINRYVGNLPPMPEDVIRQLAVDMTKIAEAEGRGLLANAQVDKAFADMCLRMGFRRNS